ncbi:hypothetical protein F4859DRAFT_428801 [Xylaria cf. heliscus]|nr:hypothetical protein F4859DRAFT_428801 [Xylaria cf. heliscus]
MAKSSRASSRKANNQRLKANVFGPVETERNARLSAKLLELAAAPKPERADNESMNIVDDTADADNAEKEGATAADETAMDVDAAKTAAPSSKSSSSSSSSSKKGRIEKRRKTSKIVFPKYSDKTKKKRKH